MSTSSTTDYTKNRNCIATETARRRLDFRLQCALSNKTNTLIDAPTSLGKSHTVATTSWRGYPEVTGDEPVIHLHETADTRDDAAAMSETAGVKYAVLKSGMDICPVAKGEFDLELPSVEGKVPSEWFKSIVHSGGYTFHKAHQILDGRLGGLPCDDGDRCPSSRRWETIPRDENDQPPYDVIHATHEFAYVPSLMEETNVIFDEQPAFNVEIKGQAVTFLQDSMNSLLAESDGDMSWVELVEAVRKQDTDRLEQYRDVLQNDRDGNNHDGQESIHGHTRVVGKAIANAEPVLKGRRYLGKARGCMVVLDRQGTLQQIHRPPDLSHTRCVIGLDAHPSIHLWHLNTVKNLQLKTVLSPNDRYNWRRQKRGLHIRQIGRDTRAYTGGWRGDVAESKAASIIQELRRQYGSEFQTSISSKAIERDIQRMLIDAGIEDPQTMHFGNLKSRNDFAGESVGFIAGCIDPGDDRILDLLALCGFNAWPKVDENGERDYGREFIGPDADAALEFLAAVRENNLAQAVGRYARSADSPSSDAVIYVWSNALPDNLTDAIVPGVVSKVTTTKEEIAQDVCREGRVTTQGVATRQDISRKYAWEVLKELKDQGVVKEVRNPDDRRIHEYEYISGTIRRSVDLGL